MFRAFTTPGLTTVTIPTGKTGRVYLWGGGGGGLSTGAPGHGGGGGGEFAYKGSIAAGTYGIQVAAGGVANGNGEFSSLYTNGGDPETDAIALANGGFVGVTDRVGGAGGSGGTGDTTYAGGTGGTSAGGSSGGGGGGGSGGSGGAGSNGESTSASYSGGLGGAKGTGLGGAGGIGGTASAGAGKIGTYPGGGGGGGSFGSGAGAAGADGLVIVCWDDDTITLPEFDVPADATSINTFFFLQGDIYGRTGWPVGTDDLVTGNIVSVLVSGSAIEGLTPSTTAPVIRTDAAHLCTIGNEIVLYSTATAPSINAQRYIVTKVGNTGPSTTTYMQVTATALTSSNLIGSATATSLPASIASYTAANPTVCTSTGHGLTSGDQITIAGTAAIGGGTTSIDGDHTVTVVDANTFRVNVNVTSIAGGSSGGSFTLRPVGSWATANTYVLYNDAGLVWKYNRKINGSFAGAVTVGSLATKNRGAYTSSGWISFNTSDSIAHAKSMGGWYEASTPNAAFTAAAGLSEVVQTIDAIPEDIATLRPPSAPVTKTININPNASAS